MLLRLVDSAYTQTLEYDNAANGIMQWLAVALENSTTGQILQGQTN